MGLINQNISGSNNKNRNLSPQNSISSTNFGLLGAQVINLQNMKNEVTSNTHQNNQNEDYRNTDYERSQSNPKLVLLMLF